MFCLYFLKSGYHNYQLKRISRNTVNLEHSWWKEQIMCEGVGGGGHGHQYIWL